MTDTTDPDFGTIDRTEGGYVLRFERRLRHRPEKVWRALTESEHLEHWMPCDIVGERATGATIELPFWPDHVERYGIEMPKLDGRIEIWDPPSVFEWWWSTDRLRWELEAFEVNGAPGTLLRFATWLGPVGKGAANAAGGYHACLGNLQVLLDTGTAPPLVDVNVSPFEQAYRAQVTALG